MRLAAMVFMTAICAYGGAAEIGLGGYAESRTAMLFSEKEIISSIAEARLEGRWDYGGRGGVEAHVLLSAALKPLDPMESIRPGSVMERAALELMAPAMGALAGYGAMLDSMIGPDGQAPGALWGDEADRLVKHLPYSSFYPSDNVILDRALVKVYFRRFDLFAGKQTIAWGTGYAFNPTDIWNRKNPADAEAPRDGVNAIRVEIPLDAVSGISLVASPGRDFRHASGGFRYKAGMGKFDVSMCAMRVMNSDMELVGLPPGMMVGADMAGEMFDIGVWAEAAVVNPVYGKYTGFDSIYAQIDAGMDYTFNNGLYVMMEYFFNGAGRENSEDYSGRELVRIIAGEMPGFARHYMFGGLRFEIGRRLGVGAFALGNLTDHSIMLLPSLEYAASDNITITARAGMGAGDRKTTELGGVYTQAILVVRGYF